MNKHLYRTIVFFILIAAITLVLYTNSRSILSNIISHKMRVPVSITDISFRPRGFSIHELKIKNPKQATEKHALKAKTITIDAPYINYIKKPVVIDEITINGVYVSIEFYDKKNKEGNWITLLKNIDKDNTSIFSFERVAIIKKLILTNITIDLTFAGQRTQRLSPIDRLEFDNVSSEKGIPTQEITEIIIKKLMGSVFVLSGLAKIFETVVEIPIDVLELIFDPSKLFPKKKKNKALQEEEAPPPNLNPGSPFENPCSPCKKMPNDSQ